MDTNGTINTTRDMEKPIQDPSQQQQHHLKCPRCDSSNTKFCYYNNYSLSQPRHFCKACKRYWTRGGTLRNVPVGGGCRKNKRIKRSSANSSSSSTTTTISHDIITTSTPNANPSHHHHQLHGSHNSSIDHLSTTNSPNHLNSLFYGLTNERSDLSIPFARLFNSRVSSHAGGVNEGQVYSLTDGIPGLMDRHIGLGFSNSSGGVVNMGENNNYGHGGFNPMKQIQDVHVMSSSNCTTSTTSLLSCYPNMFGSSSTSTMASLIASSLQQQKFMSNMNGNTFHNLLAPNYEELQMSRGDNNNNDNTLHEGGESGITMLKEEKMDLSNQQIHEQIINSSDPSLSWNGAWLDPSNMGSNSVPSLI